MKKQALSVAAAASFLLLAGCNNQSDNTAKSATISPSPTPSSKLSEPAPTAENTVAIVNGKPISRALLQSVMSELAQRAGGQNIPEDKVIDGLITRELLRQEAEKQNLAKDPAVAAKIENATRDALIQADVENFRKNAPISDEDIKKEYDTRVAAMKGTEYKARHILLDSEQAAKDALAKLQKGAKFEDLAKKLSKDSSNAKNGGELGWFSPQRMVPEFSKAVESLKDGEITKEPVKTQFGWHIIQREESREQTPPPFDAVKDQFRNVLVGQKLQQHVEELKAAAKIERLTPPAKPEAAPAANPVSEAGNAVKPSAGQPAPAPAAPAAKPETPAGQAAPAAKPAAPAANNPGKEAK